MAANQIIVQLKLIIGKKPLELLQAESEFEAIEYPPGDLDSQELPLETYLHLQQFLLLIKWLDWLWRDRTDYFAAGNLTIYFSPTPHDLDSARNPVILKLTSQTYLSSPMSKLPPFLAFESFPDWHPSTPHRQSAQ